MKWIKTILISIVVSLLILTAMQEFSYPWSPNAQKIFKEYLGKAMPSIAFDFVWNNLYYYSSQYESLAGLHLVGNAPTIDDTGITMATAASGGSTSGVTKQSVAQMVLTFDKKQAFRITLNFYTGSLTAMSAHFVVGTWGSGTDFYGFIVTNGVLAGISSSGVTGVSSTTPNLMTMTVNTSYELGAKFDPVSKSVIFLVNGKEMGSLTTNLPEMTGATILPVGMGNFYDWLITTTDSNAKRVIVGNFEYLQERYDKQ